jgi:hypothetical protein
MAGTRIHHQVDRETVECVALFQNARRHELEIIVGKSPAQDRVPRIFRSDVQPSNQA